MRAAKTGIRFVHVGDRFLMIRADGPRAGAVMGVGVVTKSAIDELELKFEGPAKPVFYDRPITFTAMMYLDHVDLIPTEEAAEA